MLRCIQMQHPEISWNIMKLDTRSGFAARTGATWSQRGCLKIYQSAERSVKQFRYINWNWLRMADIQAGSTPQPFEQLHCFMSCLVTFLEHSWTFVVQIAVNWSDGELLVFMCGAYLDAIFPFSFVTVQTQNVILRVLNLVFSYVWSVELRGAQGALQRCSLWWRKPVDSSWAVYMTCHGITMTYNDNNVGAHDKKPPPTSPTYIQNYPNIKHLEAEKNSSKQVFQRIEYKLDKLGTVYFCHLLPHPLRSTWDMNAQCLWRISHAGLPDHLDWFLPATRIAQWQMRQCVFIFFQRGAKPLASNSHFMPLPLPQRSHRGGARGVCSTCTSERRWGGEECWDL